MKWIARLVLALVVGVLVLGGVVAVQTLHSLPQLSGQRPLSGLSQAVQVRRDASDVTHIQGATALDVWRALGFVHAQERGWQLEFNRRLMHGELSEILGPATLDTDKLMRTLGIARCVIVQSAVHGFDNRVVEDAIAAGGGRYLGVALVPVDVADAETPEGAGASASAPNAG